MGLPDRAAHAKAVIRELRLEDPAVLRAIQGQDEPAAAQEPDADTVGGHEDDPRGLDDAALLARLDADLSELKRRFAERAPRERRLYGQPSPYPSHLDAQTSQTAGGSSHDRDGSTG